MYRVSKYNITNIKEVQEAFPGISDWVMSSTGKVITSRAKVTLNRSYADNLVRLRSKLHQESM